MSLIRFINTTTRMPVDQTLEALFRATFVEDLFVPLYPRLRTSTQTALDVFFVNDIEFDAIRTRYRQTQDAEASAEVTMPGTELLGCYIPHYAAYGRQCIFVSPEKVWGTAHQIQHEPSDFALSEIYSTILIKVVIHELAHALMGVSENGNGEPVSEPGNQANEAEARTLGRSPRPMLLPSPAWHTTIEESLANAYVFLHQFNDAQKNLLHQFVGNQPPDYRAGLQWRPLSSETLCHTMQSWQAYKCKPAKIAAKIPHKLLSAGLPAYDLAKGLIAGAPQVTAVDFTSLFLEYLTPQCTCIYPVNRSLKDIHRSFRDAAAIVRVMGEVDSHVLGLALIDGVEFVLFEEDDEVEAIINRHVSLGRRGLMACQADLLRNGYAAYAQL